jgi:hypothetical protein
MTTALTAISNTGFLQTSDLEQGRVYHIKNNYAESLDDLWWNNATLVEIDKEWSWPTMLTFKLESGKLVVIDGDFVSKTSGEHKSQKNYQIIEA